MYETNIVQNILVFFLNEMCHNFSVADALTMSTLCFLKATPGTLVEELLWTLTSQVLTAGTFLDIRVILTGTTSCVPCVDVHRHVVRYENCSNEITTYFQMLCIIA